MKLFLVSRVISQRRPKLHKRKHYFNTKTFLTRVYESTREPNCRELKKAKHCGIYEPELSRVWPPNGASREAEIAYFAKTYGWRLRFYKEGFCAIFDKEAIAK